MSIKGNIFKLAVNQHQRRRDKKLNITWFINLFYKKSCYDYCMDSWVTWMLDTK